MGGRWGGAEGKVVGPETWRFVDNSLGLGNDRGAWAQDASQPEDSLYWLGNVVADAVAHGTLVDGRAVDDVHAPHVDELAADADGSGVLLVLLKVELGLEVDEEEVV